MDSDRRVQAVRLSDTILALAFCLLGAALLLARRSFTLSGLTNAAGAALILYGAVMIWGHFTRDLYRLAFQHGMSLGIFAASVGVYLLVKNEVSLDLLCLILGAAALADALSKIEMAVDARAFGLRIWRVILAVGCLSGVISFLLIVRPWPGPRMTLVIGAALAASGVLNLITARTTIRARTRRDPEKESPWGA